MEYTIVYESILIKTIEVENNFDADKQAKEQCPEGYKVQDFYLKEQELTEIETLKQL